jgi:HEAT repeat protein
MSELQDLIRQLDGADEAGRLWAVEDIGYAQSPQGIAPLLERLAVEPSRAVREAIFAALGRIDDDAVTSAAIALLASEDSFVRTNAIDLLRWRGPRAIPFLRVAFCNASRDQRKMIIDTLAGMEGPGSDSLYALAIADDDINVVIAAVEALGNAGKTGFRQSIEALASSGHPMLTAVCLETLARIGNEQSVEALRVVDPDASPLPAFLAGSWLRLLGAQGRVSAIDEVAAMLETAPAHLQPGIVSALTRLHQRYPEARLPPCLVQPLERIACAAPAATEIHATGLLEVLARQEGDCV